MSDSATSGVRWTGPKRSFFLVTICVLLVLSWWWIPALVNSSVGYLDSGDVVFKQSSLSTTDDTAEEANLRGTPLSTLDNLKNQTADKTANQTGDIEDLEDDVFACKAGVIFATYGTIRPEPDIKFCPSLLSAAAHSVPLVVMGWGDKWVNLYQKFSAMSKFIGRVKRDDCVIMFNDAYDVLYSGNREELLRGFLKAEADFVNTSRLDSSQNTSRKSSENGVTNGVEANQGDGLRVLFSAECGCWPQILRGMHVCLNDYPTSPTPYRYLNSGQWAARARWARELLKELEQRYGHPSTNDQEIASDIHMEGRFKGLTLDFYSRLFQSMHYTDKDCNPRADVTFDPVNGTAHNTLTNSNPLLLHFNGNGHLIFDMIERKLSHQLPNLRGERAFDKAKALNHAFTFMNEDMTQQVKRTLREVCPNL